MIELLLHADEQLALWAAQYGPIVYGILCIVLTLVILQLWLITATMNAYLGGDESVIVPAGVVSGVCLLLNLGLLRYLYAIERQ